MGLANFHHWGLLDESESEGCYQQAKKAPPKLDPGLVLTEAGEILISRHCLNGLSECAIAIVVGRTTHALSRPQSERVERSFDIAVSITNGNRDAVNLSPVPHHWRFARADYLTIEEWQQQKSSGETRTATIEHISSRLNK